VKKADKAMNRLKGRLTEITDLNGAASVLSWDQTTYMPLRGAATRGRQIALMASLAHERAVDPQLGKLIEKVEPHAERLDPDSDDAALVRRARRDFERARRVPVAFVAELAEHAAVSYDVWTRARPADDFAAVEPYLERTVELSRQLAAFQPSNGHVADALIDDSDEGMTAATVSALFAELRSQLQPIVRAITTQPVPDDACLRQRFPPAAQVAAGLAAARQFGFDFDRGRLDQSPHPYMTRFGWGDVRITTRTHADDFAAGYFGTLHETGHGLYEQGTRPELDGLPLGRGASAGVHESQSRLWEHFVGSSRGYWDHEFPRLQRVFPRQLKNVELKTFYRAVNRVEPSLIRIYADEVTYNLHVILRFDLELQLLEGSLQVRDLPEAWRARYAADLVEPTDDRDGVLQDVHWYGGIVGGSFQGYTLGNLMAAQIYSTALEAHPEIPDQIRAGSFGTLLGWLRENLYQHGAKFPPADLLRRVTGSDLQVAPYIAHLRAKFGELYDLS
jgi:carboxypeptidase Taq